MWRDIPEPTIDHPGKRPEGLFSRVGAHSLLRAPGRVGGSPHDSALMVCLGSYTIIDTNLE
jgi:hypothetical protein